MDPVTGSVVAALTGLGVHAVAVVRQELRLRWAARREAERARCEYVTELVRALPRGSRLHEVQGDGSEVHLVISGDGEEAGRGSA
jgi:hypothetical protein